MNSQIIRHYRLFFSFSLLVLLLSSCSGYLYHHTLEEAEAHVMNDIKTCDSLLNTIPADDLRGEDAALYGLLKSWILYRQYAKEIPAELIDKAFDYYRDSKDPLRRAQVFFLHSVVNEDQKRGLPNEWMEDLYSACLAIEQTDNYLLASQIYQNYCGKFSEMQQFDQSRIWVDKFVDASRKSGHTGEYIQSLIFKSNNCLYAEEARVKKEYNTTDGQEVAKHTQFVESFAAIYEALYLAKQHNMQVEMGRCYVQLSVFHSRCQRLDSLLHYAKLSVAVNEELVEKGVRRLPVNYVTLSDAYRKLGQADSAIFYAKKTYDIPNMALRNKRAAAQLLYNVYADLKGDYKSSLEWMQIYNQLSDSINQKITDTNVGAVQDAAIKEQEKTVLKEEKKDAIAWLIWTILIGAIVIAAICFHMFSNRRRYYRQLQEQEDDFNRMLQEMQKAKEQPVVQQPVPVVDTDTQAETTLTEDPPAVTEEDDVTVTSVCLTGSTKEQVEVDASAILYLTSESNYVKVVFVDQHKKVQSKMIRQTMSNVEVQLNGYPHIVRCHRAFIVNLQHVRHASSVPTGLQLALDASSVLVPVSKTYISSVKDRLI